MIIFLTVFTMGALSFADDFEKYAYYVYKLKNYSDDEKFKTFISRLIWINFRDIVSLGMFTLVMTISLFVI